LYPTVFAVVPVILFDAYRRIVGVRIGLLAALLFAVMPMFTVESLSMVKSELAMVGLAGMVWFTIADVSNRAKAIGLIVCAVWTVVNHYTVGMAAVGYILCIAFVNLVAWKRKDRLQPLLALSVAGVVIAVTFGWFMLTSDGVMFKTVGAVTNNIANVTASTVNGEETALMEQYKERTGGQQEPLVRTALGLDFNEVGVAGKLFRVIQLFSELLLIAGGVLVFLYRYKFPLSYLAAVGGAAVLLLMCAFIPFFATIVSASRFYAMALFFVAPLVLIPLTMLPRRAVVSGVFVAAYALFGLGVVGELGKEQTGARINVPFAISLSNERLGLLPMPTENDLEAAKFIQSDSLKTVYADYNGHVLLLGYAFTNGYVDSQYPKSHLVFLTDWNTRHDKMVIGAHLGARTYEPLPDTSGLVKVFEKGGTVVYRKD
jgi:hypothetical protein